MTRRLWVRVLCTALLVFTGSMAVADDKKGPFQEKHKLKGTYTYRLVPATSFAPFLAISNVATAPRQDILRVGVFTADGAGNLKGRAIATTDDGLTTVRIDFNWTGTYTLDSQGLGEFIINAPVAADINSCVDGNNPPAPVLACETFEGAERYAIVLNPHGDDKLVNLIQTDNDGGGAKIFLTGEAKRR